MPSLLRELNTLIGNFASEQVSIPVRVVPDEHEGELSVICFPLSKEKGGSPQQWAEKLGIWLLQNTSIIEGWQAAGGYLNIKFRGERLLEEAARLSSGKLLDDRPPPQKLYLVEFSSPNTNKPQHLGHLRNNVLGWAVAQLLEKTGIARVVKINLINDRGIHICKSMLAWMKWHSSGQAFPPETPPKNKKGDHLVGEYYVEFEQKYKEEVNALVSSGMSREEALRRAPLYEEALELLRKWEQGDEQVREVWRRLNSWVLKGFEETYSRLGIQFDEIEFESETYLDGKRLVEEGLRQGVFYRGEDGHVWVDLSEAQLGKKVVLRSDGTSLYITQDLGTADRRWRKWHPDLMIYVVAEEQRHHFAVLREILRKLKHPAAERIYHLSYAMVLIEGGKLKSREGHTVDADQLMDELHQLALERLHASEKARALTRDELETLAEKIALGALKFYLLRVNPNKAIMFRKEEALDMEGYSGPFIQYTVARVNSLERRWQKEHGTLPEDIPPECGALLSEEERKLIIHALWTEEVLKNSAQSYDPSLLTNHLYNLAKRFNSWYASVPIVRAEKAVAQVRLRVAQAVRGALRAGCEVLGIPLPEVM